MQTHTTQKHHTPHVPMQTHTADMRPSSLYTSLERCNHNYQGGAHVDRSGVAHQTVTAICEARSCQIWPHELLTGTHMLSLIIQHKSRARSSAHTHYIKLKTDFSTYFIHWNTRIYTTDKIKTHTQLQPQTFPASPSCKSVSALRALSQTGKNITHC